MSCFKNVKVYVRGSGVINTDISFSNIIKDIGLSDDDIISLPENAFVLPGFIDEHIHGAGGSDTMDGNVNALKTIADCLAEEGTTSFAATTMTASKSATLNALKAVKDYRNLSLEDGAELIGVHLEGPFISEEFKGAQPLQYILKPDLALFNEFVKESGNCVKIITLAPELSGADSFIETVSKTGTVVSVGHTSAKFTDVERAVGYGAKNVTHTYNAQSKLHHRDIGTVGAALLLDELNAEVIADTIHVSLPALRLIAKNKPKNKLTLITDAMRAKGMSDGESELGGQKVFVRGGEARLVDGTLAGSVLKMNLAIKNMVEKVGVPFTDAVDYATMNPATTLGLDKIKGSIERGKNADFAVLDDKFNVIMTVRNGKVVFKA